MSVGARVVVTGGDAGLGRELGLGLADRGATVIAVEGPFATRADTERRIDTVKPFDALVHAWVDGRALVPGALVDLDLDAWRSQSSDQLRSALFCVQAARAAFGGDGGRIVLVTPTIGMTGAAGLVAYATAVEGMRSLAKSAARQWHGEGISVNCVAPDLAPGTDVCADVAGVVAMLVDPVAPPITGTTLPVDGATLMVP